MNPKKILIVDDEASITRLLKLNLERTGTFIVRDENRGSRAHATAREFKPDLILLDIMMPDMDGGDVAAQLQSDPLLRSVPIVFLTAAVKKEEVSARDGMIGGFPYIAKPLNVKGVMNVIEQQLKKSY
ncbi:MAG TPA: response regulator [Methylomirabilota bacterium]|nr:response regulator [Methylomirabilota bacterium]